MAALPKEFKEEFDLNFATSVYPLNSFPRMNNGRVVVPQELLALFSKFYKELYRKARMRAKEVGKLRHTITELRYSIQNPQ